MEKVLTAVVDCGGRNIGLISYRI